MQTGTHPRQTRPGILPTTYLGRWATALFGASVILMLGWRVLGPAGAISGFVCGVAAGVVALIAIVRRHERALAVYAAVLPLALVVLFIAAEVVASHD